MACASYSSSGDFLGGIVDYIDCQAQAIGSQGYLSLAAPGSTFSIILTALLTLFVALFGYRLLLGETPGVRDGVTAAIKVGIVLTLATSWGAYRTLLYDVALRGPAEIAANVGEPAGLPGASGGLVTRLDYLDRSMVALIAYGVSGGIRAQAAPPPYLTPGPATGVPPPAAPGTANGAAVDSSFDSFALGGSRLVFLTATAGALGSVRLLAGLLLALGPIFIAFLLFDGTRGLFEGWLRVLAGTVLGAIGATIVLGVELALLEPRIAYLLELRVAGLSIAGAPSELFATTLVFAIVLAAVLAGAARVAIGFRFPESWGRPRVRGEASPRLGETTRIDRLREGAAAAALPAHARAAAVVDAVAASQRREGRAGEAGGAAPRRAEPHRRAREADLAPAIVPIGRSFRRRTHNRVSASADRRDRAT